MYLPPARSSSGEIPDWPVFLELKKGYTRACTRYYATSSLRNSICPGPAGCVQIRELMLLAGPRMCEKLQNNLESTEPASEPITSQV